MKWKIEENWIINPEGEKKHLYLSDLKTLKNIRYILQREMDAGARQKLTFFEIDTKGNMICKMGYWNV